MTTTTDSVAGFPRAGYGARRTLPPGSAGRATLVSPDARVAPSTSPAARPPFPPRAAGDPLDREVGPVPAGRPSLPGSVCLEPAEPGIKPPPPGPGVCSRDGGGTAPGRGRVKTPAGAGLNADSATPAGLQQIAAAMSEAVLEEKVQALCTGFGILRFHNPDSRRMERGLPDDILIGPRGVLWRELKNMKRKLTPEQEKVGEQLLAHGQDWAVWRPSDLLSRRIETELKAISGLRIAGGAA